MFKISGQNTDLEGTQYDGGIALTEAKGIFLREYLLDDSNFGIKSISNFTKNLIEELNNG